jgi:FkbM family methyltransferase
MGALRKIIRRTANRFGYDVCRSYRYWIEAPNFLDAAIRSIQREAFFFVQVGAHDGISYDPIRPYILEYRWRGILVEPQTQAFRSLQENYKNNNHLILENCAITSTDGPISLYRPKQSPKGGLESDAFATVFPHHFENNQEMETVPGLTLSSLMQKHRVQRLDFLQSDAEGFDDQIVRQALGLPEAMKPRLMHFEVGDQPRKQLVALYSELTRQGYRVIHGEGLLGVDTIAIRQSGAGPPSARQGK